MDGWIHCLRILIVCSAFAMANIFLRQVECDVEKVGLNEVGFSYYFEAMIF